MPKVVIVNCWHDSNKGDAAITLGIMKALRCVWPSVSCTCATYWPTRSDTDLRYAFRHVLAAHPETSVIAASLPALRYLPRIRACHLGAVSVCNLAFPLRSNGELERAIGQSDIVISTGGSYFASPLSNPYRLPVRQYTFSYPLLLARRLGRPVVLYTQSLGPFGNQLSRAFLSATLRRTNLILVREQASAELALRFAPSVPCHVVPDSAFVAEPSRALVSDIMEPCNRGFVAFSVRELTGYGRSPSFMERYLQRIVEVIRRVFEAGLSIALVAQSMGPTPSEDDRRVLHRLRSMVPDVPAHRIFVLDQDLSPDELCAVYARAEFVIATRFHAAVLALAASRPVVCIPYFGHKAEGTFAALGLGANIVPLTELMAGALVERVDALISGSDPSSTNYAELSSRTRVDAIGAAALLADLVQVKGPE